MPLKRKQETPSGPSRKKTKLKSSSTVDDLPWKSISHLPTAGSFEDDDGILELEEVENVEVVYEDTEAGRVIKFNVSSLLVEEILCSHGS
jgi:ATP-dependent RNA helicase DDX24/MAK5